MRHRTQLTVSDRTLGEIKIAEERRDILKTRNILAWNTLISIVLPALSQCLMRPGYLFEDSFTYYQNVDFNYTKSKIEKLGQIIEEQEALMNETLEFTQSFPIKKSLASEFEIYTHTDPMKLYQIQARRIELHNKHPRILHWRNEYEKRFQLMSKYIDQPKYKEFYAFEYRILQFITHSLVSRFQFQISQDTPLTKIADKLVLQFDQLKQIQTLTKHDKKSLEDSIDEQAFIHGHFIFFCRAVVIGILTRLFLNHLGAKAYEKQAKRFENLMKQKTISNSDALKLVGILNDNNNKLELNIIYNMYGLSAFNLIALITFIYRLNLRPIPACCLVISHLHTLSVLGNTFMESRQVKASIAKINNVKSGLNNAVKCTKIKWQNHIGSSITSSSFLLYAPKKVGNVPKSKILEIVSTELENKKIKFNTQDKMLVVDPVMICQKTAGEINKKIHEQLTELEKCAIQAEANRQMSRRSDVSEESFFKLPDDSDSSESEEDAILTQEIKPEKTIRPRRKNYGAGSDLYKPLSFLKHASQVAVTASSEIKSATPPQDNRYAVKKHGKIIAYQTVSQDLLDVLNKEEKRVLLNLCSNGTVIGGDESKKESKGPKKSKKSKNPTKGRSGLIFINDEKKYGPHRIKLKDCTKDYRFFAIKIKQPQGMLKEYIVTSYQLNHKIKSKIITPTSRPSSTPSLTCG